MCKFTDEQIEAVWQKGLPVAKYDQKYVREDACGALILRTRYNDRDDDYGWEIDHIFPKSRLKDNNVPDSLIDDMDNLRPLNWKNNLSKSDDYPVYRASVKADGEQNLNLKCDEEKIVNEKVQKKIKELYGDYGII